MAKDADWHELNDRVARLAERVARLDGLGEAEEHPAVREDAASGVVVGAHAPAMVERRADAAEGTPAAAGVEASARRGDGAVEAAGEAKGKRR